MAQVSMTVNGKLRKGHVDPRVLLVHFLREQLRLTGTHIGCDTTQCGACTVLVDGQIARSCLMLAVQADGCKITTVEGLAPSSDQLHPIQEAFWEAHGLQCGFCTPGILITTVALLQENPSPTDEQIRAGLSGNLCRCTGYQNIVKAVRNAADRLRDVGGASPAPTGSLISPSPAAAGEGAGGRGPLAGAVGESSAGGECQ